MCHIKSQMCHRRLGKECTRTGWNEQRIHRESRNPVGFHRIGGECKVLLKCHTTPKASKP
jgi:hypothetical protein